MKMNCCWLVVQLVVVGQVSALVEMNKSGTVGEYEFVDAKLKGSARTVFRSSGEVSGLVRDQVSKLEEKLGVPPGQTKVDGRSGRVASVFPSKPVFPGGGVDNHLLWSVGTEHDRGHSAPGSPAEWEEVARRAVKQWLVEFEELLQIDAGEELPRSKMKVAVHGRHGDFIQVFAPRVYRGLRVVGSSASAAIKAGNLISVGFERWGTIAPDFVLEPKLSAEDALRELQKRAGQPLKGQWCQAELAILTLASQESFQESFGQESFGQESFGQESFGEAYEYRLVHRLCPLFERQAREQMEGYVDAADGRVYSYVDTTEYFEAKGGVYPTSNDGASPDGVEQPGWPMPFMTVGGDTTDTGGNYPTATADAAAFEGPFLKINDNCGAASLTGLSGLDWGSSAGDDCTTPGFGGRGNTHSSRTAFYELNKIMEIARSHLPANTWLTEQLTANMNFDQTCNAFWSLNSGINFYRSGGGCANTGEIAGILDHEWGHAMDFHDVRGQISMPSGEGIADLYAALRLNDSCIGRGFLNTGTCDGSGDPCTECSGVRDIDYEKRESGNPHTFTWSSANCDNGVHCLGATYSEAVWSLYKRILPNMYGYDLNTSLEIVTRLTYLAAGNVGTWFSGRPPFGGCNDNSGYLSYLAADDDDGNLNNGTPHMRAIFEAFNTQEIACDAPVVQDSGCSHLIDGVPQVTVTDENTAVSLSWTSVQGAITYQIFRTEGVFQCEQGKVKIAETSELSYRDVGLQNSRNYYYVVIPKGTNDSCWGRASDCATANPSPLPDYFITCQSDLVQFDLGQHGTNEIRQCTIKTLGGFTGSISLSCDQTSVSGIECNPRATSVLLSGQNVATVIIDIKLLQSSTENYGDLVVIASHDSTIRKSSIPVYLLYPGEPQTASYDDTLGAPSCETYGSECSSQDLLFGRGSLGPELNAPNVLDRCADKNSGIYFDDESIERLVIRSGDIIESPSSGAGKDMVEGGNATIIATVHAWSSGASDSADFYYTNDASNPTWIFIDTLVPSGGGIQELAVSYTLPSGPNQAVRVNFRFGGSRSSCSTGAYDEADDLVFNVKTTSPTKSPTLSPISSPTNSPSISPTQSPSRRPTIEPSFAPASSSPTNIPTLTPTTSPTSAPTTSPTLGPEKIPTASPVSLTSDPTKPPTYSPTGSPTNSPTMLPTNSSTMLPTNSPTMLPTNSPTGSPASDPTSAPFGSPTISPVASPTSRPISSPTALPTIIPTKSPMSTPVESPIVSPTVSPTAFPTTFPTTFPIVSPTNSPTSSPTESPTSSPTESPTSSPTESPTSNPTKSPTSKPTKSPTSNPTKSPTSKPTKSPTSKPTKSPTSKPTKSPTTKPTKSPTNKPTKSPTSNPTKYPTSKPTESPTSKPTKSPTSKPTKSPTSKPTKSPTSKPTKSPTSKPTKSPTSNPTKFPTSKPTKSPTSKPTKSPTSKPTESPSSRQLSNNGSQVAVYDSSLGVPSCSAVGNSCDSRSLLVGRGFNWGEPNQPNSLGGCNDGNTWWLRQEINSIVVATDDGNNFVSGSQVTITATGNAFFSGSYVHFYYTADANNLVWTYIGHSRASRAGDLVASIQYTLPSGSLQAVRVNLNRRDAGSYLACSGGSWDDVDDLAFSVA